LRHHVPGGAKIHHAKIHYQKNHCGKSRCHGLRRGATTCARLPWMMSPSTEMKWAF